MTRTTLRARLLGSVVLGVGASAFFPTQASAQCAVGFLTVNCTTNTTTVDTVNPATPGFDRGYDAAALAGTISVDVDPGVVVDGFGLAFFNSTGTVNAVNDGAIQINAGNTATAGGVPGAALQIFTTGDINYSGAGSIANFGTNGSGTWFQTTGNILATFGGNVTGATGFTGIYLEQNGAGTTTVTTAAGTTVGAGFTGIWVDALGVATAGNISVTNNATIASIVGDTLERGIVVNQGGTGSSAIINNGTIGSSTDRMLQQGILSLTSNASNNALTSVSGSGAIWSVGDGIQVGTTGTGGVTVNYSGAINTTAGDGIQAASTTGALNVTSGAITAVGGDGINARSTDGNQTITANGNISATGGDAIDALATGNGSINGSASGTLASDVGNGLNLETNGTGGISFTSTGTISSTNLRAVEANVTSATGGSINLILNNLTNGNAAFFNVIASSASNTGNVSVSTGGTTSGGLGVDAQLTSGTATGSVSVTNTGTFGGGITAANAGSGTVTVTNNGALTGTTTGIAATSAGGAVLVQGSGPLTTSAGDGIRAINAGAGTTTVNYTGAINATGGDGVDAQSNAGALAVTTNAVTSTGGNGILTNTTTGSQIITVNGAVSGTGFDGINATSSSGGAITVNANANVTGVDDAVQIQTSGASIVNVAAGRTLSGAYGVYAPSIAGGTLTINNNGTITGTTESVLALADQTVINNNAGATITGPMRLSTLADTINNRGTINYSGSTSYFAGADLFANLSGGVLNLNGATVDFGADADTLTNASGATINVTAASSLLALETFTNNGALNLNTFALTGSGTFVNGATGVVDTNGAASLVGFTSMTNNGVFDIGPGTLTLSAVPFVNNGTVRADEGVSTLTGQTSFTNGAAGVIDLQDGATGDQLTIASNYIGGGRLQVDVSQSAADRLILTGTVSGTTAVDINVLGATTLGLNQLVVDASSASAGAFVTGNVTGTLNPLADYVIAQVGQDYFVNAIPNVGAAFDPLAVTNLVADFWYQSGYEVMAQTRLPIAAEGFGVWGQVYGSIDKSGENDAQIINGQEFDANNKLETSRYGIQAGVDFGFGGGRIGLTGGWGKAEADGNAEYQIEGWNLGLYGQFGGELGFHGEALVKYDKFDVEFTDGAFEGIDTDGHSWGGDIALGYRFAAGRVPIIDINAGLSHVRSKIDDVAAFGFGYDYGTYTSTRARGGVRAYFNGGWRPYIDATVNHEFDGKGDVALFDGTNTYDLRTNGKGTWVRLEGGLGGKPNSGPMLAVWGDVGDRKGAGIRLGFRFGGAREEAVLPPPPPPMAEPAPLPPPPPATQTCADGSVILATEACPPPPPPPPAAEPERG